MKSKLLFILGFFYLSLISYSQTLHGSFESKFKRYQKNEGFSGTPTQSWNTVAWKGERIHKQIVLWSDDNIKNLNYKFSELKNVTSHEVISKHNNSVRFPSYVKGDISPKGCPLIPNGPLFPEKRGYVEIADALLDTPKTIISPSDPLKLWITINIPRNIFAGTYKGEFVVYSGIKPLQKFEVEIQVTDKTIPEVKDWEFHLDIWQWPLQGLKFYNTSGLSKPIKPWSNRHFKLLEPFYKILADMGQKVAFTQINSNVSPMVKWSLDKDGTWEFDFTVFDKYVEALERWGINKQISCRSLLENKSNQLPYIDKADGTLKYLTLKHGTIAYKTLWFSFLTDFKQHLLEKNWFDKTVLYMDEVREEEMNAVVSFVKAHDSDWKLGLAYGSTQSKTTMAQIYDACGILGVVNPTNRRDKINTFYTSCTETIPNNYITPDNNVAEMTWMPWHASREGLNGYLRWAFDLWQLEDPFDERGGHFTSGDYSMIYRSNNGPDMKPVMGIRTEMLREGIQDFEKIKILKEEFIKKTDTIRLKLLNGTIDKFTASSGYRAMELVKEGQNVLQELSLNKKTEIRPNRTIKDFNITVNPDFNEIIIDANKTFEEIEIMTYEGKRVFLQKLGSPSKKVKTQLSNLPADHYLIRIKTAGDTYVEVIKL